MEQDFEKQPESDSWVETVTRHAAALSLVEVALGSAVHSLKIPFGGHWMSLNQGMFLTRVARSVPKQEPTRAMIYVSNISATLKSLSPAGNKLGPMLAISAQGFLFSLPIAIAGVNFITVILSMILLSLWAFVQPFISLYVLYGSNIEKAFAFYLDLVEKLPAWMPLSILGLVLTLIGIKIILAVVLGTIAFRSDETRFASYQKSLLKRVPKTLSVPKPLPSVPSRLLGALREIVRPYFLISLVLMGVFFFFQEGSLVRTIWLLLRPIAIGFVLFYLARSQLMSQFASRLRRDLRFQNFMRAFDLTVQRIRKISNH
jgi:hypothetical protein